MTIFCLNNSKERIIFQKYFCSAKPLKIFLTLYFRTQTSIKQLKKIQIINKLLNKVTLKEHKILKAAQHVFS